MAGTLHIFRRSVANGPTLYQINYTADSHTFAKVVEGEPALRHFLDEALSLGPTVIDGVWNELGSGAVTIDGVDLSASEAIANGMLNAPSDF